MLEHDELDVPAAAVAGIFGSFLLFAVVALLQVLKFEPTP